MPEKLMRCPWCGGIPIPREFYLVCLDCGFAVVNDDDWNRLARLVRKGLMFEWLERNLDPRVHKATAIKAARDWWKEQRR
jgi:hypothetical protein